MFRLDMDTSAYKLVEVLFLLLMFYMAGVFTAWNFNPKRWDVLARAVLSFLYLLLFIIIFTN